jgi:type IV secretion system protein VirB9
MKYIKNNPVFSVEFICHSLIFLLGTFLAQNVFAKNETTNQEPQVKTIQYQSNQIITLKGTHFIATSLQFSKNEKIKGIYIGDQIAWTYAINPSTPYIVFLKPTVDISDTNMTVITNQHLYHFHLLANKNRESEDLAIYSLKFDYTTEKKDQKSKLLKLNPVRSRQCDSVVNDQIINSSYFLSGSKSILPRHVYDDGRFTYFEFSDNADIPAIFKWEDDHEKLINTQIQGNTVIAKCTAKKFVLQKNEEKAWAENQ